MDRRTFLAVSSAALAHAAHAVVPAAAPSAERESADRALQNDSTRAIKFPAWVRDVTRMAFVTLDQVIPAAEMGVQVCHTNVLWPYYPLLRDGGRIPDQDDRLLKEVVRRCHDRGMKLSLGLPPFPPAALLAVHPEWRHHSADNDAAQKIVAKDDDLGTRLPCNLSPWGDYLIDVCGELVEHYQVDGFSFDGNYHPAICYCPACKAAYRMDQDRELPARVQLEDLAYREYLAWRGDRLEQHYAALQKKIKSINPDAAVMTWTVNAGRYGHFLHSPRAMPTRLNRLIDLPMQEWWLDETNFGASVAPAFGAAYVRAVADYRPAASEAYMMSRGNPYGTDSFPVHERLTRSMLSLANGCVAAESLGWPGHFESTRTVLAEVKRRESLVTRTSPWAWCGLLVSEQTRQFHAFRNIAEHFLPHVFGAFRVGLEEHFPMTLLNDWDVNPVSLAQQRVVVLPSSAALSDAQVAALREYVKRGGGLVATGETSLCDELGRPRPDLALADVFGVSYRGRTDGAAPIEKLDVNFQQAIDEKYWQQRVGVATLTWNDVPFWDDARLKTLVPHRSVTFRGPQAWVTEPKNAADVAARMLPAGSQHAPIPAAIARNFGAGRVVYFPACLDAALWSYSYPYQRRMLARAIEWAAGGPPALQTFAPMCVQTTYWTQQTDAAPRTLVHFFNGVNTTAHHGVPVAEVPLREETLPIYDIRLRFPAGRFQSARVEPTGQSLEIRPTADAPWAEVTLPKLELHLALILT